jgi:CheY-like chemotaxis protein
MPKGKIVLIDDDPTSSFLSKFIVKQIDPGIEIVSLLDCSEILKALDETTFHSTDLLLLDINLGLCSGWDVLDIIEKQQLDGSNMPIIVMLSSSINSEDREKAQEYNCVDAFISKPLQHETVLPYITRMNKV